MQDNKRLSKRAMEAAAKRAYFEAILDEAHAAAKAAVDAMGPEDRNALDCGFAWVTVDGMEPLARYCRDKAKEIEVERTNAAARAIVGGDSVHNANVPYVVKARKYGSKAHPKGWQWWKPGGFNGQAIGHHEAGAKAFRDVLAKHNIVGTTGTRYD